MTINLEEHKDLMIKIMNKSLINMGMETISYEEKMQFINLLMAILKVGYIEGYKAAILHNLKDNEKRTVDISIELKELIKEQMK